MSRITHYFLQVNFPSPKNKYNSAIIACISLEYYAAPVVIRATKDSSSRSKKRTAKPYKFMKGSPHVATVKGKAMSRPGSQKVRVCRPAKRHAANHDRFTQVKIVNFIFIVREMNKRASNEGENEGGVKFVNKVRVMS